jgi:hypothetical protein
LTSDSDDINRKLAEEDDDGSSATATAASANGIGEASDAVVEEEDDILDGFGSASITSTSMDEEQEEEEEEDNEYYRNQKIADANKTYIPAYTSIQRNANGTGASRANKIDVSEIISSDTEVEEERLAANNKLSVDDINFVINTIKKEAQYDELSIKQLFYGMASAFTKRPIHHIVNSKEAGAGKNYLLDLVSRYFPDQYVTPLGNMSDKALFHRRGILVITDPSSGKEQSILPIITMLNEEKDILEEEIAAEKYFKLNLKLRI